MQNGKLNISHTLQTVIKDTVETPSVFLNKSAGDKTPLSSTYL